jgi:hypothetical protein
VQLTLGQERPIHRRSTCPVKTRSGARKSRNSPIKHHILAPRRTFRQRKREMIDGLIAMHLQNYKASGAELIQGTGHFVAPKTIHVRLTTAVPGCCGATGCS